MSELHQAKEIKILTEKIQVQNHYFSLLKEEINKAIIGQEYMVERLLIGLLGNGHILLEGVPGLAKTLAIKTLSEAVRGEFSRIQFTPDLLPADQSCTFQSAVCSLGSHAGKTSNHRR